LSVSTTVYSSSIVVGGSSMPASSKIAVLYQKPTTPSENGSA
jgi:hypothetical protein